ncbi:MAG: 5-(carboxyamino)imidazole ribonucleotide synthase [Vicinamibacteraceae bacterium]
MTSGTSPILPGAVIGVLGSGQLGRMLALAAGRLGYRVHTYSPEGDSPTGHVADAEIVGSYDDLDALRRFADGVDAVTFEFENVPATSVAAIAERALVRPAGSVLHTTQHRGREKAFLSRAGLPVAPYASIETLDELSAAVARLGLPAVLKTASFGYDGKGQARIDRAEDALAAWDRIGRQPAVLEAFVDFERELSVVAARGVDGRIAHYGVIENGHARHILDVSVAPARVPPQVEREAIAIAHATLEALDVIGVLCVELFLTRDGRVLVNELAPRTHNSGHLTIDACPTSQFEQQLRAVCGLPLGATDLLRPAAMANLLGDLWQDAEPRWADVLARPGIRLHLYGKREAKPGRKMGHLTALADSPEAAAALVREARAALTPSHVRA